MIHDTIARPLVPHAGLPFPLTPRRMVYWYP
jgi:hypothetical protein